MTAVLSFLFPLLAGICLLATLYFLGQAIVSRARMGKGAYSVAKQEARQAMQVNIIRAVATAFVGLIFLGVWGITPFDGTAEGEAIATPGIPVPTETATTSADDDATAVITLPAQSPTPTSQPTQAPTNTPAPPTATPTTAPTDTPNLRTGTINIPAGVWLRSAPGLNSEQVEWLLDQTEVIILDGRETADDLQWQQIRTLEGQEGWVWADTVISN